MTYPVFYKDYFIGQWSKDPGTHQSGFNGMSEGFWTLLTFFLSRRLFVGEFFLGGGGKQFSLRVEWLVEKMEGAELAGSTWLQRDTVLHLLFFLKHILCHCVDFSWFFHFCTFSDFFFTFPADSETPTPIFHWKFVRSSWVLLEVPWICWSSKWIWLGGGRIFLGNLVVETLEQWSKLVVICCHNRGMTFYLVSWGF